jgi:membrane-bound metal-dependent hydrolase YbcI (DUF457 family)
MLVGHLAVGLAGKRVEPRLSLGTLVLGALLADLLWCVFMIAGVEQVRFKPGLGAAHYFEAVDLGWSHSLLMNAVWGGLLAAAYFARRRHSRGAGVLFAAVLSHWVLDFASHRPDMPLAPAGSQRFGLGLWTSVPLTLVVEGGLWLGAILVYTRVTRAKTRLGSYAFWSVAALVTLAWYNNIAGPPPANPRTAALASMMFFSLLVAWAFWMNRVRPSRASLAP